MGDRQYTIDIQGELRSPDTDLIKMYREYSLHPTGLCWIFKPLRSSKVDLCRIITPIDPGLLALTVSDII